MSAEFNPLKERERHIIGPGTEILGGKLLMRAAIVVDTEENPGIYQHVLDAIDSQRAVFERMRMPMTTQTILRLTNDIARRFVPFDDEKYRRTLKAEATSRGLDRLTTEDEIGLSRFIGTEGICYQHSLLSGTMLRMMQERGDIGGSVSIAISELLESPGLVTGPPVQHTKVVFAEDDGQRYAIDTHTGVARMPRQA